MNGAEALVGTLGANGVDTVFANAGTSEMHVVAALDGAPAMRPVLCLFEGVATGAADGYARVAGRPAATLLHLGPGLANGWANLHNARRAHVPVLNVVGAHPRAHDRLDPPLASRLAELAGSLGGTVTTASSADDVPTSAVGALAGTRGVRGGIATLVLPADVAWSDLSATPPSWPLAPAPSRPRPPAATVEEAWRWLRDGRAALVLGGSLGTEALADASSVAAAAGARLLVETFPAVLAHGAGVVSPERVIYLSEFAIAQLADLERVVLVGAAAPVGFFAYPGLPSRLLPPDCRILDLAEDGVDPAAALADLARASDAVRQPGPDADPVTAPDGDLNPASLAAAVAATLSEDAVVVDEANTAGLHLYSALAAAPPHRLLTLTGGAIGFGLPAALGAALGSGARVTALVADGAAMYTVQALWSLAREGLDVTVVVLANHAYDILRLERTRLGPLPNAGASHALTDLSAPTIDHVALARGYGVAARRVTDATDLVGALRDAAHEPGPHLIEVPLPAMAFGT